MDQGGYAGGPWPTQHAQGKPVLPEASDCCDPTIIAETAAARNELARPNPRPAMAAAISNNPGFAWPSW